MTCEELLADIQLQDAKIAAADIQIEASNLIKAAAQTQKWISLMNWYLQGCNGGNPPAGMAAVEGVSPVMPIAELLNPTGELLVAIESNPATSLLLKLAKLYWGSK